MLYTIYVNHLLSSLYHSDWLQILISFIIGSLFLLAYCSEVKQSTTFPGTIRAICGQKVEVISALCIILYTYGTCITFLIVINDQLTQRKLVLVCNALSKYLIHLLAFI